jgi:hypothetical protein
MRWAATQALPEHREAAARYAEAMIAFNNELNLAFVHLSRRLEVAVDIANSGYTASSPVALGRLAYSIANQRRSQIQIRHAEQVEQALKTLLKERGTESNKLSRLEAAIETRMKALQQVHP